MNAKLLVILCLSVALCLSSAANASAFDANYLLSKVVSAIYGIPITGAVVQSGCTGPDDATCTKTCTDSDGGINYQVKGSIKYVQYDSTGSLAAEGHASDACAEATINGVLSDNALREYYCTESSNVDYEHYECPYGCKDGACIVENGGSGKSGGAVPQVVHAQTTTASVQTVTAAQAISIAKPTETQANTAPQPTATAAQATTVAQATASEPQIPQEKPIIAQPTSAETQPVPVAEQTGSTPAEPSCDGCRQSSICIPVGGRNNGKYCGYDVTLKEQTEKGACDNNFECKSNLCINSNCVTPSFWQKILSWFGWAD